MITTKRTAVDLVTGGSGYLGEVLVRALVERGRPVRILDLNPSARPMGSTVEFSRIDIRDAEGVARAVQGVDRVFHAVAQVPLAKDRRLFWSVNVEGTRTLLREAARTGVSKIVYISSSAVYGVPASNPVSESSPRVPAESYGRAKLAGETLCRDTVAEGHDVSIIRPRTILGHGRLGIFQLLFEWVRTGYNVPVLGRGDNLYQFVHVDDLVDACLLAAERKGAGEFNIGAQQFGTMRQSLEALIQHARTRSRVVSVPAGLAELGMRIASNIGLSPLGPYHSLMYGRSLYFDCSKASAELGWRAKHSNADMICESYDWYCQNRSQVLSEKGRSAHSSAVRERALGLAKRFL